MIFEWVKDQMAQNQFAQGAVMATIVGAVLAYCKQVPHQIFSFLKKRFICSISINDSNDYLDNFLNWTFSMKTFKDIRRVNLFGKDTGGHNFGRSDEDRKLELSGVPDTGVYFGWIDYHPVWLSVSLTKSEQGQWNWKVSLSAFSFTRKFLDKLFKDFQDSLPIKDDLTVYFSSNTSYDPWISKERAKRSFESLYYNGETKEEIEADIKKFVERRSWYFKKGIPYKRAYLLASKPGTGKTSLALAIASLTGRSLYVVNLGNFKSDKDFLIAWKCIQKNSVVLIDDIDIHNFNLNRDEKANDKLGLASLLNAIDGSASLEDAIIIITTNKPEMLDEALTRKGRIDKTFVFDYFSFETAVNMSTHFFEDVKEGREFVVANFGQNEGFYIKPAELQEKLMQTI